MTFTSMSGDTRLTPPQPNRLHLTNLGDGVGLFRGVNGSIIEFKTLKAEGATLDVSDECLTIVVAPNPEIRTLSDTMLKMATSLEAHRRQLRDLEVQIAAQGAKLAGMKPYVLPEHLGRISELHPFDGSVLLAEKGVWKVGNLRQMFELVSNKIERVEFQAKAGSLPRFLEIEKDIGILKNTVPPTPPPPVIKRDWVPYILWAGTMAAVVIKEIVCAM